MLLAIDIGNTNLELGFFRDGTLLRTFRLATRHDATSDELGLALCQYMQLFGIAREEIEDVAITSVVPQIMYSISSACRKYLGLDPLIVGENLRADIPIRYDNPGEVGSDRLVNAIGAYHKYGGPLLVVDFGTATTFNAVGRDGAYLGGAIMPGIRISMQALFERTAKLPRVELVNPGVVIGKNTVQAMQAGFYHGYAGALINLARLVRAELGADTRVIVTGGLSGMFAEEIDEVDCIDKELTLTGLWVLYDRRRKSGG